jgi:hypothetical protein
MTEEAHARARTRKQDIETRGLTDVCVTAPLTLEAHTRRRIVHQYDVHTLTSSEPIHLVECVVAPGVTLKRPEVAEATRSQVTTLLYSSV